MYQSVGLFDSCVFLIADKKNSVGDERGGYHYYTLLLHEKTRIALLPGFVPGGATSLCVGIRYRTARYLGSRGHIIEFYLD